MPIHRITFNLPEERDELSLAMHGNDWYAVVWDLVHDYLRYHRKMGKDTITVEELSKKIHDLMYNHNVNLDMVS